MGKMEEISKRHEEDRRGRLTIKSERPLWPQEWKLFLEDVNEVLKQRHQDRAYLLKRIAELEAQLERERIEARPVYKRLKQDIAELEKENRILRLRLTSEPLKSTEEAVEEACGGRVSDE